MPVQLAVPLEKEYILEQADRDFGTKDAPPTTIIVRQARQGEHERRAALFASIVREQNLNAPEEFVRFVQRFSLEELKKLEVFLTLKSCNIEGPDGKPLWKFNRDGKIRQDQFDQGWELLPVSIADEIHACVQDLNVDWQRRGEEF